MNVSAGGKYHLLDRVKDDNNNEIGTVSGFFTDANDVEYAVVCLDAQYRLDNGKYADSNINITGIPKYYTQALWEAKETATENTTAILASDTSTGCTHCRSKTFTVDGISYAGQLPNLLELIDIFKNRTSLNAADTSASSYSSLTIPEQAEAWSSTQNGNTNGWSIYSGGSASYESKNSGAFVVPVLEIPNS